MTGTISLIRECVNYIKHHCYINVYKAVNNVLIYCFRLKPVTIVKHCNITAINVYKVVNNVLIYCFHLKPDTIVKHCDIK